MQSNSSEQHDPEPRIDAAKSCSLSNTNQKMAMHLDHIRSRMHCKTAVACATLTTPARKHLRNE